MIHSPYVAQDIGGKGALVFLVQSMEGKRENGAAPKAYVKAQQFLHFLYGLFQIGEELRILLVRAFADQDTVAEYVRGVNGTEQGLGQFA